MKYNNINKKGMKLLMLNNNFQIILNKIEWFWDYIIYFNQFQKK